MVEIEDEVTGEGSGPGCHGYHIDKSGLKLAAYNSVGESFLGVNCNGTASDLDNHMIKWIV